VRVLLKSGICMMFPADKNLDNVEEATEKFKEVQAAFTILNDPVLRGRRSG
jgi:curved DNA-binding protein CbpA